MTIDEWLVLVKRPARLSGHEPAKISKRLVEDTITKAGLRVLKQMDDQRARIDEIYDNLAEKEAAQLRRLLDKIRG